MCTLCRYAYLRAREYETLNMILVLCEKVQTVVMVLSFTLCSRRGDMQRHEN